MSQDSISKIVDEEYFTIRYSDIYTATFSVAKILSLLFDGQLYKGKTYFIVPSSSPVPPSLYDVNPYQDYGSGIYSFLPLNILAIKKALCYGIFTYNITVPFLHLIKIKNSEQLFKENLQNLKSDWENYKINQSFSTDGTLYVFHPNTEEDKNTQNSFSISLKESIEKYEKQINREKSLYSKIKQLIDILANKCFYIHWDKKFTILDINELIRYTLLILKAESKMTIKEQCKALMIYLVRLNDIKEKEIAMKREIIAEAEEEIKKLDKNVDNIQNEALKRLIYSYKNGIKNNSIISAEVVEICRIRLVQNDKVNGLSPNSN